MTAQQQIVKATQRDIEQCFFEAQYHYINGIQELLKVLEAEKDVTKKKYFSQRIKNYLQRGEEIQKMIKQFTSEFIAVKHISIREDATGHSFEELFGECFDPSVKEMLIEETYLNAKYQIHNLISLLELSIKKCPKLQYIGVTTKLFTEDKTGQSNMFEQVAQDLRARNILITFSFENTLHDRKIILSNGYIIKIGRGLHIFQRTPTFYSLGVHDFYFRKCKQTEVDIMRSKHTL